MVLKYLNTDTILQKNLTENRKPNEMVQENVVSYQQD